MAYILLPCVQALPGILRIGKNSVNVFLCCAAVSHTDHLFLIQSLLSHISQKSENQHSGTPLKHNIDYIKHNISRTGKIALIYHVKCKHQNKEPKRVGLYNISQYKPTPLHPHGSIQCESLIQQQINRYNKNQHQHILLKASGSDCCCCHRTNKTDQPCQKI